MTKYQIPEPNSDETDANDTKETNVEEGLDYDNEDYNESGEEEDDE